MRSRSHFSLRNGPCCFQCDRQAHRKNAIGWDEQHIFAVENAQAAEAAVPQRSVCMAEPVYRCMKDRLIGTCYKTSEAKYHDSLYGQRRRQNPEDAKRMLEEVGADAVMIGRAALGNPWIHRTKQYLETGELLPEPTPREKFRQRNFI